MLVRLQFGSWVYGGRRVNVSAFGDKGYVIYNVDSAVSNVGAGKR